MNSHKKRSWNQYNKNLINRGSITFWLSEDSTKKWKAKKTKKHFGRPFVYSEEAIYTANIVRYAYNLSLRASEGFIKSIFSILGLKIPTPSYTQICRRSKNLKISSTFKKKRITDIVLDASGLKVYGEGEWKVRTHGYSKRRTWKKLHIGICPDTQQILVSELTESSKSDIDATLDILDKIDFPLDKVYGDGLYDAERIYKKLWEKKAKPIIPLKKNVRYLQPNKPWLKPRNEQLYAIFKMGGDDLARGLWKKLVEYHKRSLVETAFSRWKRLLGASLKSRKMETQTIEVKIKCEILNKMRLAS
jgi:hypothetical protein